MTQASQQAGRHTGAPDQHALGLLVSRMLAGAWREPSQTPIDDPGLSEKQLAEITPLLCQSGAAALGWWRIRHSLLANSAAGHQLREVYRRFRLSALIHEREISYVLSLLRAVGIEPVLVKGWAIARRYPDRALRPYGDIDLCVRPDQFEKAKAALQCLEHIDGHYVDLHGGFSRIGVAAYVSLRSQEGDSWDELFARTQVVFLSEPGVVTTGSQEKANVQSPLSNVASPIPVRILSDEDHLRVLSLHLLRSGAWRPPWLCDVALLLETRNAGFDWAVCLGRDRLHAGWVAATVGLAHQLLGADIEETPFAKNARQLPRWLVPAVLRQWGRLRYPLTLESSRRARFSNDSHRDVGAVWGSSPTSGSKNGQPVWGGAVREGLLSALSGLYARWDNPVRSTAAVGGQFNNWPRLPYRAAELVTRIPELPQQLKLLASQLGVVSFPPIATGG